MTAEKIKKMLDALDMPRQTKLELVEVLLWDLSFSFDPKLQNVSRAIQGVANDEFTPRFYNKDGLEVWNLQE